MHHKNAFLGRLYHYFTDTRRGAKEKQTSFTIHKTPLVPPTMFTCGDEVQTLDLNREQLLLYWINNFLTPKADILAMVSKPLHLKCQYLLSFGSACIVC